MRNIRYLFWIFHLVNGVSGVEELQLMVGDSVTLHSAETPSKETIQWLFETKRIAEIRESRDPQYYDERFKDRLELDKKTGSLTIKNININHSGQYRQNIADINRKNIAIQVRDGEKNVSVMKGDTVTLHTDVTLRGAVKWTFENEDLNSHSGNLTIRNIGEHQSGNYLLVISNNIMILRRTIYVGCNVTGGAKRETVKEGDMILLHFEMPTYDQALWKIEDVIIAESDTKTKHFKLHDKDNERFNGRLQLLHQTGFVIINSSKITDSGDYQLILRSSTYSLLRTISVTVENRNSGVSPVAEAGIVVGLLVFHWCLQL